MSNVSDLTIEVLKGIRADLADLKAEVAGVRDEVAGVRDEVAGVKEEVADVRSELKAEIRELREDMNAGFVATHQRIDAVLQITGVHHLELESRVRRIEDHLKLPHS